MPLYVGAGYFPATISNNRINRIACSDTPPEMNIQENIQQFFCSTHKSEALSCIWEICHPSAGTTREDVKDKFEQLKRLAYPGFGDNIKSGHDEESRFCILDEGGREILSVTIDANIYIVVYPEGVITHHLSLSAPQGDEGLLASCASATAGPQTAEEYEAAWSAWERAAPPEEAADRAQTVQQLQHCLQNDARLNISDTSLTSLPPLPPGLQTLIVYRTPLTRLPSLPSELQKLVVSDTRLTSLPQLSSGLQKLEVSDTSLSSLPRLPSGLQTLGFSNTPLTGLPRLPSGLQTLNVSRTRLTSLPQLPLGLQALIVYRTPLTSLPHLPDGLQTLNVSDTRLTRLLQLPSRLQTLIVYHSRLTRLPPLPPGLQTLEVVETRLTRLPESIANLSPEARVTLQNNHLSAHTIQALRDMTNEPGYQGPSIAFDRGASSAPQETRALHLAVADWLTPAEAGGGISADRWQAIGSEDDAAAFSRFLDRLKETKNNLAYDFHVQIATWLTQLAQDDGLRAKTFAMATESTSSCEDRVTLAMNNMKSVQLVHNAEKGEFDDDIAGLVSVGREMFRLEQLELIAREKVKTLRSADEIEVFLGYQNQLKKSLELTGTTEAMQYFDESKITESDLQSAEIQVKSAENSQFGEWILQWEPLHNVLIRKEAEDWKALINKKMADYEREYQELYDTALEPAGLVGNIEAERTIGARAIARAEKAFQNNLRPLAEKFLTGHLGARWLLDTHHIYH
ncbi:hypothetical protein F8538_16510 [Edwardsiella ictaluri]|uniref:NEL-type E3 ubiquitin ligase domain-containing protein n=1 Tax=Edwardsiella ictaluri TaxID=67780 RepID=UPI0009C194D0|nr:NEL-type E3 ubiquitin ligase domain-containing protein [Edwardsiella ictaluri]ARD39744.1 hypothetical protein B6E78_10455 [Edwardsiella ictaluri]QPW28192.1 hypothetical protein F8538_16510 [Edwardsiella ictaluri]